MQQDQKELERLNTLSDKAKNACDKAFQSDDTKEFDDLIKNLVNNPNDYTDDAVIEADAVIGSIAVRRSPLKAGAVLKIIQMLFICRPPNMHSKGYSST